MKDGTLSDSAKIMMYIQRLPPTMQQELLTIWDQNPESVSRFFEGVMQKHHAMRHGVPGAFTAILEKEREEILRLVSQE